ncbi:hypothetical protein HYS11_00305 [Candidatus Gottesmanbacteria bacterium]|nr:hypothetical protein [Candidatus Gottesmanbacteria bacterium]
MSNNTSIFLDKMIPVTEARRNLGELLDKLPEEKEFYLLRGGKIAAKLVFPDEIRKKEREKALKEAFGAWKRAGVPDNIWEIIKSHRRSRKKPVRL